MRVMPICKLSRTRVRTAGIFIVLAAALLVGGCSSVRLVDSEVRAFATAPHIPANATYRFERLPSQQSSARQPLIEGAAEGALAKVGLRRDDAQAQYSVLVSDGLFQEPRPYNDPWYRGGWSGGFYAGNHGHGVGLRFPLFPFPPLPLYIREVGLIIRDLASTKAVFETRAVHDGPTAQDDSALPAMFEAALRDFPNPPTGPRRINIEVPRTP